MVCYIDIHCFDYVLAQFGVCAHSCEFAVRCETMAPTKQHLREIMLFHFHKKLNAASSAAEICDVYGPQAVHKRTVQVWFQRFRGGDYAIEDRPRSGRPQTVDTDQIITVVDANPHLSLAEISDMLDISEGSAHAHLISSGYRNRADVWVPHELSERALMERINTCALLLEKENEAPFLKRMITGDEKLIVYNNVVRRRSWSAKRSEPQTVAKAGLHPKKVMLCIWWDCKGVVYFELLKHNETINSVKYCQQLDNLKKAIAEKRPELANRKGVVFHHDNARPHTSVATCQRLHEFSWDVLPHPPYSPDLAPSDYHLFRSLQNSLMGKNFASLECIKKHLNNFFESKTQKFWMDGINCLTDRWKSVIERGGQYIID